MSVFDKRDLPQCVFVWGVWLVMSAALLGWIAGFGSTIPYMDDWAHVPVLSAATPLSVGWLWADQNGHRFPLSKAIMWSSWKLSGGSVRAELYLNAALLGAVALALTVVARRLRGAMSYADAFFPFALLHWGLMIHFMYLNDVYILCEVCLVYVLLMFLAAGTGPRGTPAVLAAAVCLLLLPLHGGGGVAFTPALAMAVAYVGATHLRSDSGRQKRNGLILLASAAGACLLIIPCLAGGRAISQKHVGETGFIDVLWVGWQAASQGLGALGSRGWPLSGVLVAALSLATVWVLVRAWQYRPDQRTRAVTLLLALGAAWSVALAIGVARTGAGATAPRYIIQGVPLLCCAYLVWCLYGPPAVARFVQMSLFTVMCAFSTYHVSLGMELGKMHRRASEQFERDIADGVPMVGLVGRHAPYWCWDEDPLARGLKTLHDAGTGIFAKIRPDPPMKELPFSLEPSASNKMTCTDGAWSGEGRDSSLTFSLGKPTFVYAVRLKFSMEDRADGHWAQFEALWPRTGEDDDPWQPNDLFHCILKLHTGPEVKTQTIWINGTIDRFHVRPDEVPFTFQLEEIVLLVKSDSDGKTE